MWEGEQSIGNKNWREETERLWSREQQKSGRLGWILALPTALLRWLVTMGCRGLRGLLTRGGESKWKRYGRFCFSRRQRRPAAQKLRLRSGTMRFGATSRPAAMGGWCNL